MANTRALDKRRKSVRNIRKITRTMELIATARFKKAMDRAAAANDYTERITQIVRDLAGAGLEVSHPLLAERPAVRRATVLMLTSNRGLCGGYNGSVIRTANQSRTALDEQAVQQSLEVSGKRGITAMKFRGLKLNHEYTKFDDEPKFEDVAPIADRLMDQFINGQMDRLDVVYTRFVSSAKQIAVSETLLPFAQPQVEAGGATGMKANYEFLPSASSILDDVVPASFRVKLFKCFLDAAVSEQIARMVAMKSATENAGEIIRQLSMTYNRARQAKITQEIMEIIGGVEALEN
ncbi:MAG: ATP synthase F1 subunit gamma [Pirellulaceae bacterium]|nr:ATP synthase F1 subunit gamma [Pirellulaceae bacterium]